MNLKGKFILVLTSGRSGSSMLCGLLHHHGLWCGPVKSGDWRNPDGFFENSKVYSCCAHYMHNKYGLVYSKDDGLWHNTFLQLIKEQGWDGSQPVVMKHLPNTVEIWRSLKPTIITCRRNLEAQIASRERIKKSLDRQTLEYREHLMDCLEQEEGVYRVDSEKLIAGDYSQLVKPLEEVRVLPDFDLCNKFINKDYWHFKSKSV